PRGGQPGHRGTARPLRPVAEVDELHVCQPTHCAHCGNPLRGSDPSPLRHQVTELPPLKPTVTEYQLHALHCGQCGGMTRAPLPAGVPERAFGPRLQALNRTTGHSYTQAASCEHSSGELLAVASACTAAVTSGV